MNRWVGVTEARAMSAAAVAKVAGVLSPTATAPKFEAVVGVVTFQNWLAWTLLAAYVVESSSRSHHLSHSLLYCSLSPNWLMTPLNLKNGY